MAAFNVASLLRGNPSSLAVVAAEPHAAAGKLHIAVPHLAGTAPGTKAQNLRLAIAGSSL